MDFITKNKTSIIGLAALAALVWGYFTFFGGSSSAPLTAVSSDSALSGNLLTTLNSLHTIRLDSSLFSDPVFLSLSDFGTTIPDEPSGRPNPFAPLSATGGLSGTSANQPSSNFTTKTTTKTTPKSSGTGATTPTSNIPPVPPPSSIPAPPAVPTTN